ncbi:GDSL esterase/lipase-like [Dorcoceras hygrometricum]|uniref:GDSL esterase/lipase-like n=1 Tax=Dorcoceras hygrometricum TaxID=472368 RepID=A0A2Z7CUT4_9LAMI|nr:GDSL esterase/lipase-like [Dorcoceras hygrometricum]
MPPISSSVPEDKTSTFPTSSRAKPIKSKTNQEARQELGVRDRGLAIPSGVARDPSLRRRASYIPLVLLLCTADLSIGGASPDTSPAPFHKCSLLAGIRKSSSHPRRPTFPRSSGTTLELDAGELSRRCSETIGSSIEEENRNQLGLLKRTMNSKTLSCILFLAMGITANGKELYLRIKAKGKKIKVDITVSVQNGPKLDLLGILSARNRTCNAQKFINPQSKKFKV